MLNFYYKTVTLLRQLPQIAHQRCFGIVAVSGKFYLRDIEQNTPAVASKSRKAYHFQIGINFRTEIDHLQYFAVKGGSLVVSKPLGIHVGKQTAE